MISHNKWKQIYVVRQKKEKSSLAEGLVVEQRGVGGGPSSRENHMASGGGGGAHESDSLDRFIYSFK